jgi:hypothetical protein
MGKMIIKAGWGLKDSRAPARPFDNLNLTVMANNFIENKGENWYGLA